MNLRPIALAVALCAGCADPPTFVLSEGNGTDTSETQPAAPAVVSEPTAESPGSDDGKPSDAGAPARDASSGKGKGKGGGD